MAKVAYVRSLNKIITVDEFISLESISKIEDNIFCETKDCKARFVYHSASETKEHHFQKFPGEKHSDFCELRNTEVVARNTVNSEKIKSTLDDDGYDTTLNNVLKFLESKIRPAATKNSENSRRKGSKTTKTANEGNDSNHGYTSVLSLTESLEDQEKKEALKKAGVTLRNPPVFRVSLNQLSEKHNSSIRKTYGIIEKVKEVNEHSFEVYIKDIDSGVRATLVLNESFFSTSSDVGLTDYLRMLKDYISRKKSKEVIVLVVFELRKFNAEDIVLFVNDESGFRVVINDPSKKLRKRKLALFAALYKTKAI